MRRRGLCHAMRMPRAGRYEAAQAMPRTLGRSAFRKGRGRARGGRGLVGPVRFALFQKGGDAFIRVAPEHIFHHRGPGADIGLIQWQAELIVKGALADMDGGGEFGGEGFGELAGLVLQRVGGSHAVDEAHLAGAGGGEEFAGGQHLEGHGRGDLSGEGDHGGGAEQADIDAVHAEAGILGRDDQIAGGGKLAASGSGDAVDLRDDRLRQGGDALHQGGAAGEEICKSGGTFVGLGAGGLHFLEIMARAKGTASAAQDDDADGAVGGEAVKFGSERCDHGIGQRIERGRAV